MTAIILAMFNIMFMLTALFLCLAWAGGCVFVVWKLTRYAMRVLR